MGETEANRQVQAITLDYGADDPLILEVDRETLVADWRGPAGTTADQARQAVEAALATPPDGPPLEAHVVPGDRVVIALVGDVPQAAAVVTAVTTRLAEAGVPREDTLLLHAPPLERSGGDQRGLEPAAGTVGFEVFDAAVDAQTSYVAADDAGQPIYLARRLVDADVVVGVGGFSWDASLGTQSTEGELWPACGRQACRREFVRALASRGRRAVTAWRSANQEAAWHLGITASLRIVAGRGDTLAAARFGLPDAAARAAAVDARAWRPRIEAAAALTVASLSSPRGGLSVLRKAVAAAARVTQPAGTICIASRLAEKPGVVFTRWREGAPVEGLVREALGSGDPVLIEDAFQTRFFARALGDRRLVLLCDLDQDTVEELELGYAATPEVVERLAHRSASIAVLHEADRMLPRGGARLPQSPMNDTR